MGVTLLLISNTWLLMILCLTLALPDFAKSVVFLDPFVVGFNLDGMLSSVAYIIISNCLGRVFDRAQSLLLLPKSLTNYWIKKHSPIAIATAPMNTYVPFSETA
jgi:hypothetical protein